VGDFPTQKGRPRHLSKGDGASPDLTQDSKESRMRIREWQANIRLITQVLVALTGLITNCSSNSAQRSRFRDLAQNGVLRPRIP